MEPWLIVLLAAVLAAGVAGAYWYYRRRIATVPVAPQYVSGGASYMITLGIGTPAEIAAFILFGLEAGAAVGTGTRPPSLPFPPWL